MDITQSKQVSIKQKAHILTLYIVLQHSIHYSPEVVNGVYKSYFSSKEDFSL
jgi:hypothetical protein